MSNQAWRPEQYLKFESHRFRPALELLGRIAVEGPRWVVDVGCGTGHVTRMLAERWPSAQVLGVDNSQTMLDRVPTDGAQVEWVNADIATWTPTAPPDVLFSNAALHWLPDHATLFPRLFNAVAPGGVLAVQMPLSWALPSHRLMREGLADDGSVAPLGPEALRAKLATPPVHAASVYYDLLAPHASAVDIWETEYVQVLTGEDPVLEWVTSTGLRPILNGLSPEESSVFLPRYREALRAAYPQRPDGSTLYPFRRLFLVATRN